MKRAFKGNYSIFFNIIMKFQEMKKNIINDFD